MEKKGKRDKKINQKTKQNECKQANIPSPAAFYSPTKRA